MLKRFPATIRKCRISAICILYIPNLRKLLARFDREESCVKRILEPDSTTTLSYSCLVYDFGSYTINYIGEVYAIIVMAVTTVTQKHLLIKKRCTLGTGVM